MTGLIKQDADALAALIPDGAMVAVAPDYAGIPMELTRAMVRRGVKGLHLVCVPVTGMQGDMLIGAGCVDTVETSAVTLGEFGGAPRFQAALKAGTLKIKDATCPAVHAAIQAGQKGIPYMPLRGIIGSDVLANRDDWIVQQNPFSEEEDPIVLLPALRPDVTLAHGLKADRDGNVYVGIRREIISMAHASTMTICTVEEIVDDNLLADDATAAGTLPAMYVGGVAVAEKGCWPLNFWENYPIDDDAMLEYVRAARSDEGFQDYLDRNVLGAAPAAAAE